MRARNIKPGFFLNEKLADVDYQTRLLFIGLWCYADREGRFEWRPKKIKAAIFPYDNITVDELLCNLMSLHFVTKQGDVGYVENFKVHQSPHPHEAKSKLPEKDQQKQCDDIAVTLHGMSGECHSDSLIPDSLIQKKKEGDKSPVDLIWTIGLRILTDAGASEKNARTFLGKHVKTNRERLAEVISQMAVNTPVEPIAYIEKALQPRKREVVV
jgi:hypothetical protein